MMINPNQITEEQLTEEQEIYCENILDHYKHPHNYGMITPYTFANKEKNPLCGDEIQLFIQLDNNQHISEVTFLGHGCAISQASASMLTDALKHKTIIEAQAIIPEDILAMLNIPIGIVRRKCALLPLKALHNGITKYQEATTL